MNPRKGESELSLGWLMNGQQPYVAWDGATSPFGTSLPLNWVVWLNNTLQESALRVLFPRSLIALALETLLLANGTACSLNC